MASDAQCILVPFLSIVTLNVSVNDVTPVMLRISIKYPLLLAALTESSNTSDFPSITQCSFLPFLILQVKVTSTPSGTSLDFG